MLARLDAAPGTPFSQDNAGPGYSQNLSLRQMAENVNSIVNTYAYRDDELNWGQPDYWQTPSEFLARGGDCEDFAIAKYAWLRKLGVPEENLRIAVVYDRYKYSTHTVLTVDTDAGAPLILDNQTHEIRTGLGTRYQPLFSINRQAWWRHRA